MIELTIDGTPIKTQAGKTVMEVALENGIDIPRLCYHPELSVAGGCRLCQVEVEGWSNPTPRANPSPAASATKATSIAARCAPLEPKNPVPVSTEAAIRTDTDATIGVAALVRRKPGSCLLYTSPSPRDKRQSRMPSSA